MSLFGEVVLKRDGYGRPGVSSLFPLDTQLNLPPNKHSHGLRQRVGQEVAKGSFDAAVDSVERTTGRKATGLRRQSTVGSRILLKSHGFLEVSRARRV